MNIQLPNILNLPITNAISKKSIIENDGSVFGGRGDLLGVVREGVYIMIEGGEQIGIYVTDPNALTVKELCKICDFYKKEYSKKATKETLIKILTNQKIEETK